MPSLYRTLLVATAALAVATTAGAQSTPIHSRFADVNGLRMHYLEAGTGGSPVLLLHGYAQNSHMWRPLMQELGKTHRVIAPDLRGFGETTKAASGYDKKTMAQDVHALARSLSIAPTSGMAITPSASGTIGVDSSLSAARCTSMICCCSRTRSSSPRLRSVMSVAMPHTP